MKDLPADIAFVVATKPMQTQLLSDEEEACIANAVDKRKWDFRSGRHAAKAALQQLGFEGDNILLPVAGSNRPNWPAGYVGSITHTAGFCAAAVASRQDYQGIGIDVEPRTAMRVDIVPRICSERERAWIAQQPDDQFKSDWGKVIFCIKETLYKVFNPIHQVFLGFQEAEVELSRQDGSFTANIHQREQGIKCTYSGRFSIDEHFIYASTLLPQKDSENLRLSAS